MLTDLKLNTIVKNLQDKVISWAVSNQLWEDSKFIDYLDLDDEPSVDAPCVTVLLPSDELHRFMHEPYSRTSEALDKIMDDNSFSFNFDGNALYFYCLKENVIASFINYFEWKWISGLIQPDYLDLHDDLFSYFHNHPEKLHALTPRKFEVLMSEMLMHNGYETFLGRGTNDQGVDILLFKKIGIDTQVTAVQVKRYDQKYAIELDAVASLFGVVHDRRIHTQDKNLKGLFITTSRYLPSARSFANRNNDTLELADKKQILEWSFNASVEIRKDKSQFFTKDYILGLLKPTLWSEPLIGSILVSTKSNALTDTVSSDFFILIKDSKHVSLILRLPKKITSQLVNYNSGYEAPVLDHTIISLLTNDNIFRVKKKFDEQGTISFTGQRNIYFIWDGKPVFFLGD